MVSPLGQPGCSLVRLTSLSRDGDSVARGTTAERAWQRPTRAGGRTRLGGNEPTILARRRAVRRPDRRLADLQRDERGDLVAERGRIHVGPVPVITPRSCIRSRCVCTVSRATPRRREASGAPAPGSADSSSISATSIWSSEAIPVSHTRRESAREYVADPALCFMFSSLSYCIMDSRTPCRSRVLLPGHTPPREPPAPHSHHNGSSSTQNPANSDIPIRNPRNATN